MLVHFFVNGSTDSAAGERASRIADAIALRGAGKSEIIVRDRSRTHSIYAMVESSLRQRPDVIYCMDLAAAPVISSCFASRSCRVIIDTGDAPSDFLSTVGASRQKY